jgi:hypothetical protein
MDMHPPVNARHSRRGEYSAALKAHAAIRWTGHADIASMRKGETALGRSVTASDWQGIGAARKHTTRSDVICWVSLQPVD